MDFARWPFVVSSPKTSQYARGDSGVQIEITCKYSWWIKIARLFTWKQQLITTVRNKSEECLLKTVTKHSLAANKVKTVAFRSCAPSDKLLQVRLLSFEALFFLPKTFFQFLFARRISRESPDQVRSPWQQHACENGQLSLFPEQLLNAMSFISFVSHDVLGFWRSNNCYKRKLHE